MLFVAHWAEVAKRRVVTARVVEAVDVVGDGFVGFGSSYKGLVANALLLQARKERFRYCVVVGN